MSERLTTDAPITLTYERPDLMEPLLDAVHRLPRERGDFVIYRAPFRWKKYPSAEVLSNCYEMFSIDEVCAQSGLELVHDFNHVAIVRRRP